MTFIKKIYFLLFCGSSLCAQIKEITSMKDFNNHISNNSIVYVKTYAPWCGACTAMTPLFNKLSEQVDLKEISFVQINIDIVNDFGQQYDIQYLPTFITIINGKEVKKIVGALSYEELHKIAQDLITMPLDKQKGIGSNNMKQESSSQKNESWYDLFMNLVVGIKNCIVSGFQKIKSIFV